MAPGWQEVSISFTGDCYFPLLLAYFTHWLQDTEEKNLWDPVQRASQSVYPGVLTMQWTSKYIVHPGQAGGGACDSEGQGGRGHKKTCSCEAGLNRFEE